MERAMEEANKTVTNLDKYAYLIGVWSLRTIATFENLDQVEVGTQIKNCRTYVAALKTGLKPLYVQSEFHVENLIAKQEFHQKRVHKMLNHINEKFSLHFGDDVQLPSIWRVEHYMMIWILAYVASIVGDNITEQSKKFLTNALTLWHNEGLPGDVDVGLVNGLLTDFQNALPTTPTLQNTVDLAPSPVVIPVAKPKTSTGGVTKQEPHGAFEEVSTNNSRFRVEIDPGQHITNIKSEHEVKAQASALLHKLNLLFPQLVTNAGLNDADPNPVLARKALMTYYDVYYHMLTHPLFWKLSSLDTDMFKRLFSATTPPVETFRLLIPAAASKPVDGEGDREDDDNKTVLDKFRYGPQLMYDIVAFFFIKIDKLLNYNILGTTWEDFKNELQRTNYEYDSERFRNIMGTSSDPAKYMFARTFLDFIKSICVGKNSAKYDNIVLIMLYFANHHVDTFLGRFSSDVFALSLSSDKPLGLSKILNDELQKSTSQMVLTYVKIRSDNFPECNQRFKVFTDEAHQTLRISYNDTNVKYYEKCDPPDQGLKLTPGASQFVLQEEVKQQDYTACAKIISSDSFKYNTEFIAGPFTQVFPPDPTYNNENIAKQMGPLVDAVVKGQPVMIIGYGASGAGKTSTLVYFNKERSNGILIHLCKDVRSRFVGKYTTVNVEIRSYELYVDDTISEEAANKSTYLYRTPTAITFVFDEKSQDYVLENEYNHENMYTERVEFMMAKTELNGPTTALNDGKLVTTFQRGTPLGSVMIHMIDNDRYVMATTNNKNSSRSHAMVFVKFVCDNDPKGTIVLCDFAGVENKFECDRADVQQAFLDVQVDEPDKLDNTNKIVPAPPFYTRYKAFPKSMTHGGGPFTFPSESDLAQRSGPIWRLDPTHIPPIEEDPPTRNAEELEFKRHLDELQSSVQSVKVPFELYLTGGLHKAKDFTQYSDSVSSVNAALESMKSTFAHLPNNSSPAQCLVLLFGQELKTGMPFIENKACTLALETARGNLNNAIEEFNTCIKNAVNFIKQLYPRKSITGQRKKNLSVVWLFEKGEFLIKVDAKEVDQETAYNQIIEKVLWFDKHTTGYTAKKPEYELEANIKMQHVQEMFKQYNTLFKQHVNAGLVTGELELEKHKHNSNLLKFEEYQAVEPLQPYMCLPNKDIELQAARNMWETLLGKTGTFPGTGSNSLVGLVEINDNHLYGFLTAVYRKMSNDDASRMLSLFGLPPLPKPTSDNLKDKLNTIKTWLITFVNAVISTQKTQGSLADWLHIRSEKIKTVYQQMAVLIAERNIRRKIGYAACHARMKEGVFINKSLEDTRELLRYILMLKGSNKINMSPSFVDSCFPQYCKSKGDCLKIDTAVKRGRLTPMDTILMQELGKSSISYLRDMVVCVMCVFNLSKNANNPPPVPYLDINDIKQLANAGRTEELRTASIDFFKRNTKNFATPADSAESASAKKAWDTLMTMQSVKLYQTSLSQPVVSDDAFLREAENFIHAVDTNNAASALGTIEYCDALAKFNATNSLCITNRVDEDTRTALSAALNVPIAQGRGTPTGREK